MLSSIVQSSFKSTLTCPDVVRVTFARLPNRARQQLPTSQSSCSSFRLLSHSHHNCTTTSTCLSCTNSVVHSLNDQYQTLECLRLRLHAIFLNLQLLMRSFDLRRIRHPASRRGIVACNRFLLVSYQLRVLSLIGLIVLHLTPRLSLSTDSVRREANLSRSPQAR